MANIGRDSMKSRDFYKHYQCIKPIGKEYKLDEFTYRLILHDIFDNMFDVIVKEGDLDLPFRLGTLFLRRLETKPEIKEGKVRYVAPVDWYSTKKLWETDSEAKAQKKIVKFKPGVVFSVKYLSNYFYHNKTKNYTFRLLRSVQRGKLKDLAQKKAKVGMEFININM